MSASREINRLKGYDNEKVIQYNPSLRGVNHCLCHQPYWEASADDRFGRVSHCRV
jgi:hypothetical protein